MTGIFAANENEPDPIFPAILFVTHNPALAERCDRTIQVIDGMVSE